MSTAECDDDEDTFVNAGRGDEESDEVAESVLVFDKLSVELSFDISISFV